MGKKKEEVGVAKSVTFHSTELFAARDKSMEFFLRG
jgi:hypothetical protein